MRKFFSIVFLLLLTACTTAQDRLQARNTSDNATCAGYGVQPGSDAYVVCRLNQANLHAAEDADRRRSRAFMFGAGLSMLR